jgi:hypothetical protein
MKNLLTISILLASLFAAVPQVQQTINIPVQNPSFEQHGTSTSDGPEQCGQAYYNIPGWKFSASSVTQLSHPNVCTNDALPPDGAFTANAGWGSTISQDVGPISPNDGIYTLKVWVANRYYWYGGSYKAAITITDNTGTGDICSTSGYAMGDFTQITLVCPSQRLGSGELKIVFTGTNLSGFPVLFAGPVSLTFTQLQ